MFIGRLWIGLAIVIVAGATLMSCAVKGAEAVPVQETSQTSFVHAGDVDVEALIAQENLSTIYLAGGCFWGVEEYMSRIPGVYDALSGYANGDTLTPSYEDVLYQGSGHAETVRVVYDPAVVTLEQLLDKFFQVVDPTSRNRQGNDVGTQYRSGIYYTDTADQAVIADYLVQLGQAYNRDIVVENQALENFYPAEDYHQDYLKKNENGYCHIDLSLATQDTTIPQEEYVQPSDEEARALLSDVAYDVTRHEGTEAPFTSELNDNNEVGLYVDVLTGEPLFLSIDKYDSGTGWPSFTRPVVAEVMVETAPLFGVFSGTELKSRAGLNHLGHVFPDGPKDDGGLRYCINGAALRFVPYDEMVEQGYGYLQHRLVEDDSVRYQVLTP